MSCNVVRLNPFLDDRIPGVVLCDSVEPSGQFHTSTLEHALADAAGTGTIVSNAHDVMMWMYQHLHFKISY